MPAKSKAQERYMFANASKFGGKKNVLEEYVDSAPKDLPERLHKKKKNKKKKK